MTTDAGVGPDQDGSGPRRYLPLLLAGIALGMHLMVGLAYLLTVLLAPRWAAVLLAIWWLALLFAGLLLAGRRTALVLLVPVIALASWAAAIGAGDHFLGWRS
jgi:hypothetical protein